MCGLTGILLKRQTQDEQTLGAAVTAMAASLRHRGPDDAGQWVDANVGVALGHRRLAVVDLSVAGAQPMVSRSGRFIVVLNGEIYNFRALRAELAAVGQHFRGHSDTEVATAAFEQWGVVPALQRFVGMFAFAVWDREQRALYLARDRIGEKPLYYARVNGDLVFGSELKALRRYPGWHGAIDRNALAMLLRYSYIPAPHCIYSNARKLPPGSVCRFSADDADDQGSLETYWSAAQTVVTGLAARTPLTATNAVDELDALLRQSIGEQMLADVPVGAFLSGGIDSSAVTAIMQQLAGQPVRSFSIGFEDTAYNEADHAARVAAHLGTQHTELYVTPAEARDVIPLLPTVYDEPFADSSQIPTYLIARLARRDVTVALTGDGGDELFGGYNRYLLSESLWRRVGQVPLPMRAAAGALLRALPATGWDAVVRGLWPLLPARLRDRQFGRKLHKLAAVWGAPNADALYVNLISMNDDPDALVIGGHEPAPFAALDATLSAIPDNTERMMFIDLVSYLPDDILAKVDRASMAVSLETRVPLLDHRLVEFCARIPLDLKVQAGVGKWILRQVLARYLPPALFERPKMGFGVPIEAWLRGPLRDWGEALLDEQRLREEGFFHVAPVRALWHAHQRGDGAEHYRLWPLLMFQAWLAEAAADG